MLCTVWQGWQEDLLHHIGSATLYHLVLWGQSMGCPMQFLFSWLPFINFLYRCNDSSYVRKWTFKSSLCHESVVQMISGHAYNCILQAHFLTHQALASILLSQSSVLQLCKIYKNGLSVWWKMHARCYTGPSNGYIGSAIYAKPCSVTLPPSLGTSFLHYHTDSTLHSVRMHLETTRMRLHLFYATGYIHYEKSVDLYDQKMCRMDMGRDKFHFTQRKTLPLDSHEGAHMRGWDYR